MTGGSEAKDAPHPFTDKARALGIDVDDPGALAWMEEHLPEFRLPLLIGLFGFVALQGGSTMTGEPGAKGGSPPAC